MVKYVATMPIFRQLSCNIGMVVYSPATMSSRSFLLSTLSQSITTTIIQIKNSTIKQSKGNWRYAVQTLYIFLNLKCIERALSVLRWNHLKTLNAVKKFKIYFAYIKYFNFFEQLLQKLIN